MFNLDVALASFWQLAKHWQQDEAAKLEMFCEARSLNIQLITKCGPPDHLHFHHPSAPPCKRNSPSQLRRQERRRHAAIAKVEEAKSYTLPTVFFFCESCDKSLSTGSQEYSHL